MRPLREEAPRTEEPPPPVLGQWRWLYLIVLGVLAATIAGLAWLTAHYR